MKRFVIAVLLLFCVSVGTVVCAAQTLGADIDDVRLTEITHLGDISAAEGLTVISQNHWKNHLIWTTTHNLGQPKSAQTDAAFSSFRRYGIGNSSPEYLIFQTEIPSGYDFSDALQRTGVSLGEASAKNFNITTEQGTFREFATDPALGAAAAFNALYMDAPPGQEVRATIHLQDYYDYYPISLELNLPGVIWTHADISEETVAVPGTQAYVVQYFRDCFKIPMIDEVLEIHLTRAYNHISWGSGSGDSDTYSFYAVSAANDTDCYFTFNTRTNRDNRIVDTSEIRGGYGIYRLPYQSSTSTTDIGVNVDAMEMVYPLEPGTEIEGLYFNRTGTRLILVTKSSENQTRLDIIDPESYVCLQSFSADGSFFRNLRIFDTYTVAVTSDCLSVLTEEDGIYTLAFTADILTDAYGTARAITSDHAMAFDGSRLAVASNAHGGEYGIDKCGYDVTVYSADGVLWDGTIESTLDAGLRRNSRSQDDISPLYGDELTLIWE